MAVTRVVVSGLTATGTSTVGRELAERMGARFIDGDVLAQTGNTVELAAGSPPPHRDPWPGLAAVRLTLRGERRVVVACSALTRASRDALRAAGGVRFIHLFESGAAAERHDGHLSRLVTRGSESDTFEPRQPDETDVVCVDGHGPAEAVAERAAAAVATVEPGTDVAPALAIGGSDAVIGAEELASAVRRIVGAEASRAGLGLRVLLVPPDHTRMHGRSGVITQLLYEYFTELGCEVWALPAVGTHRPMTPAQVVSCFGAVPFERVLRHDWRDHLAGLGEISSAEIAVFSGGAMTSAVPIEVDEALFNGWDLVVSIGQVVPHEVIGIANFTKNLMIGLGGAPTINSSHLLGALCDMEKIMGRAQTPVRDLVDAAFDRFLASRIRVLWVLTVVEETDAGVVQRGLFAGTGRSAETGGAAYRAAAALSAQCNIISVPEPLRRVVCWIDPDEFATTWLANKAVYRTRMALADRAELILLAPGVARFGEDDAIDRLIRRHGYRGTAATLDAIARDPELAENLGAAAHLIHGSSEGRFDIVYCTDLDDGGLSPAEVEAVGYKWRPLPAELQALGVDGRTPTGARRDRGGEHFDYISRPALGLWTAAGRI